MKKLIIITMFTSLILLISYLTIFSEKGFVHLRKLKTELAIIAEINTKYSVENKLLREEIDLLKYNTKYIEEKARKELGLVKDREIIYHLKKNID